jgi:hypothetical protein
MWCRAVSAVPPWTFVPDFEPQALARRKCDIGRDAVAHGVCLCKKVAWFSWTSAWRGSVIVRSARLPRGWLERQSVGDKER